MGVWVGGCLCFQLRSSLPLSVPQFPRSGGSRRCIGAVGPPRASPADGHSADVGGHPAAASAPGWALGGRRGGGHAKWSPPRCGHPRAEGYFCSRQMCRVQGDGVAQLCRGVGAVPIPPPTLPPPTPVTPPSLGHRRGTVRGFAPKPVPEPSRPPPRPHSWRFRFCISAAQGGTQPARPKLGGSNGRTRAPSPSPPPPCPPSPGSAGGRCRNTCGDGCATRSAAVTFPGARPRPGWRAAVRHPAKGWIWAGCWGPFVGAKPQQGDLEERGSDPPAPSLRRGSHPAWGWGHLRAVPVQVVEERRWRSHLLHGVDVSPARLVCVTALVPWLSRHRSSRHRRAEQLSISCRWRWVHRPGAISAAPVAVPAVGLGCRIRHDGHLGAKVSHG